MRLVRLAAFFVGEGFHNMARGLAHASAAHRAGTDSIRESGPERLCRSHVGLNPVCFDMGQRARRKRTTARRFMRSEEHTSELQSLMRISYAVFCLKKKKHKTRNNQYYIRHTESYNHKTQNNIQTYDNMNHTIKLNTKDQPSYTATILINY